MKKYLLFIGLLFSSASYAVTPNIEIDGTIPSQITAHAKTDKLLSANSTNSQTTTKNEVVLLHITLSNEAKATLAERASKQISQPKPFKITGSDTSSIQLGMNGVPVFDQGRHGSCATFASTAAIDAAYGKGDYISQLCNLELGSYLHQQNWSYPSGWDGSLNQTILEQMEKFGVISMSSQVFRGCAGVHFYPIWDESDTGNPMPISEYTERSENIFNNIYTTPVLRMSEAFSQKESSDILLNNVKKALRSGHRIIIGSLLDRYQGEAGATGKYSYQNDSWILTPEIQRDAQHGMIDAGHALVITGYDDNAVISGPNNTTHRGVLTLRNSWGFMAGDYGSYYMSYDYFKMFAMEVIEVNQH